MHCINLQYLCHTGTGTFGYRSFMLPQDAKPSEHTGGITMDLQEISVLLQAGKAKIVNKLVQQAIDAGIPAQRILDEGLLAGINIIGAKFKKRGFVPEVLVAARAMTKYAYFYG